MNEAIRKRGARSGRYLDFGNLGRKKTGMMPVRFWVSHLTLLYIVECQKSTVEAHLQP